MKRLFLLGFLLSTVSLSGPAHAAGTPVTLSAHGTPVVCSNCTPDLSTYQTTSQADGKYVPFNYGTSGVILNGEYHFANGGTFVDPSTGNAADAKFGNAGIATTFFRANNTATFMNLTGSGNAYACLTADGVLYRSSTACQ